MQEKLGAYFWLADRKRVDWLSKLAGIRKGAYLPLVKNSNSSNEEIVNDAQLLRLRLQTALISQFMRRMIRTSVGSVTNR